MLSDNVVGSLDISDQDVPVLDLHLELSLERVVDVDGSADVGEALWSPEVGFESDRDRGPAGGVDFDEALGDAVDDSSGGYAGLVRVRCAH